jgi:tetratricopeptide (TPR) repeat protein
MSEDTGWAIVTLDEKVARRYGLPPQVPVPKGEFESLADKGIGMDAARKWIGAFLQAAPNSWRGQNGPLASRFDAFLGKTAPWARAEKAFAAGDFAAAASALKLIARLDPNDHAAKMNLAMALARCGDVPGAKAILNDIRETFAGDADYHVTLGHLLMGDDREAAIGEMVLALESKPDNKAALDALVKLGVLCPVYENARDASSLTYVRADSVLTYLTGVWDQEPRTAEFFLDQFVYHESEGRFELALGAAERAIANSKAAGADVGPERAELGRIACLRGLGKRTEASAAADAYVARCPESAGAYVERAANLAVEGNTVEAREALDRALSLDPGDQQALVARFWPEDRDDLTKVSEAMPTLQAFAEAHPESAGVWRSLARAKLIIGGADEAIVLLTKAVRLAPTDDDLRAELWAELTKVRRLDEVLADAATLGDMRSRSWRLRWGEAEAYAGLGKKTEAQATFMAINLDTSLHVDVRRRAKRAVERVVGAQTKA